METTETYQAAAQQAWAEARMQAHGPAVLDETTDPDTLRWAAQLAGSDPDVAESIAANPHTPAETLLLVREQHHAQRCSSVCIIDPLLLTNPNLPAELAHRIAGTLKAHDWLPLIGHLDSDTLTALSELEHAPATPSPLGEMLALAANATAPMRAAAPPSAARWLERRDSGSFARLGPEGVIATLGHRHNDDEIVAGSRTLLARAPGTWMPTEWMLRTAHTSEQIGEIMRDMDVRRLLHGGRTAVSDVTVLLRQQPAGTQLALVQQLVRDNSRAAEKIAESAYWGTDVATVALDWLSSLNPNLPERDSDMPMQTLLERWAAPAALTQLNERQLATFTALSSNWQGNFQALLDTTSRL